MLKDTSKVNTFRLMEDMSVKFVTVILKLGMPCLVTILNITETKQENKCVHFLGLSHGGSFDDLATQYIQKNVNKTLTCSLCGKISRDFYDAKKHLESKHFPTDSGYECQSCNMHFNTFQAFSKHNSKYHRDK